ncbi:LLM class flavin-dependent oxidoreductase [Carbonactinospora thermoautotrophica]|uniref:LLM class flavin-dependent oxidoreductase n=1 Tax=Carbonactinospora thermoautotrophica TaxID=1469144 RepID=UPI0022706A7C|nr:LLM class flavin-dependent oxidoreductase [Carbonactinospora thermoautotrophica]
MYLPPFGVDGAGSIASHVRHAEEAGLESVWVGDHLIPVRPILDSTLVLATAAAATEQLGFGVLILALRPVAWAAKQVATLQHLSGDRVLLGVGAGGDVRRDAAWRAVGVPYRERGKRTDAALEVLPSLVEGEPTVVDGEEVTLAPEATMPPVLIGGGRRRCGTPRGTATSGIRRSHRRRRSLSPRGSWSTSPPSTAARHLA